MQRGSFRGGPARRSRHCSTGRPGHPAGRWRRVCSSARSDGVEARAPPRGEAENSTAGCGSRKISLEIMRLHPLGDPVAAGSPVSSLPLSLDPSARPRQFSGTRVPVIPVGKAPPNVGGDSVVRQASEGRVVRGRTGAALGAHSAVGQVARGSGLAGSSAVHAGGCSRDGSGAGGGRDRDEARAISVAGGLALLLGGCAETTSDGIEAATSLGPPRGRRD